MVGTPLPNAPAPKTVMIPVELLKHYRPQNGMNWRVIKDVPPPVAGAVATDYKDEDGRIVGKKLWAGTVVELPPEEARKLLFHEITVTENVLDEDGRPIRDNSHKVVRHTVTKKVPLAERRDPLPDERTA